MAEREDIDGHGRKVQREENDDPRRHDVPCPFRGLHKASGLDQPTAAWSISAMWILNVAETEPRRLPHPPATVISDSHL